MTRLRRDQTSTVAALNNGDERALDTACFVEVGGRLALEWEDGRWARLARGVYTRLADVVRDGNGFAIILDENRYPIRQERPPASGSFERNDHALGAHVPRLVGVLPKNSADDNLSLVIARDPDQNLSADNLPTLGASGMG